MGRIKGYREECLEKNRVMRGGVGRRRRRRDGELGRRKFVGGSSFLLRGGV